MSAALDRLTPEEDLILADADLEETAPPPVGSPDLDEWLDSRLAVIAALQAQQRQNTAVADRRKAMIEDWMVEQNASIQRRIDFLTSAMEMVARSYPYPKGKTRKLPCGEIGLRLVRSSLKIIDKSAALAFARAHEIPTKVEESVAASALKEYAESAGETPDGCEYRPGGQDEPYVKAREVEG